MLSDLSKSGSVLEDTLKSIFAKKISFALMEKKVWAHGGNVIFI